MSERVMIGHCRFARCLSRVCHAVTRSGSHVLYPNRVAAPLGGSTLQPQSFYLTLQIIIAISSIIVVVVGFLRWANRKLGDRIIEEIKEATYQIQPKANGGLSLRDLHKKVDGIASDVGVLKTAVLRLESDVKVLESDIEEMR